MKDKSFVLMTIPNLDLSLYSDFVKNREQLRGKFNKTQNTNQEFPIFHPEGVFEKPLNDWTHSEIIRLITFQITGMHTHHAQENLVILREFVNNFLIDKQMDPFHDSTLQNGIGHFYTSTRRRFSYDFTKNNKPSKEDFVSKLMTFLTV